MEQQENMDSKYNALPSEKLPERGGYYATHRSLAQRCLLRPLMNKQTIKF